MEPSWCGGTEAGREAQVDGGALVEVLREQAEYLRGQLAEEREARRRADTIIAQLTQANATLAARVPELEAPQEHSEAAETVEEAPSEAEAEAHFAAEEAREELGAERVRREMAETTLHEGMAEERRRREEAERERDDLREQLYARSRQQGAPETVEETPDREEPRPATGGAQAGAVRRLWRRWWFGTEE